ncbi:hypothetical protein C8Q76DRAFT_221452 [Earliella scabrosa]|nr:hypothetical protein C8Q76DRAFT_221452 [Earliella scabrosa]
MSGIFTLKVADIPSVEDLLHFAIRATATADDAVSSSRKVMQDAIAAHALAAVRLKSAMNSLTPVGKLPEEILALIMLWVAKDAYEAAHTHPHPLRWIRVTHVCHTWRTIALATPALWANIHYTQPDVFRELLARSKHAPLSIAVNVDVSSVSGSTDSWEAECPRTWADIEKILPSELPRMQELRFQAEEQTLQALLKQMSLHTQKLERLFLATTDIDVDLPPILPNPGSMPRLHYLELRNIPVRWDDAVYRLPLTVLKIYSDYPEDDPSAGTLSQLLTLLRSLAPSIEILELERTIPVPELAHRPPSPDQIISFPRIKSLRLLSNIDRCCRLLEYSSFPNHEVPPSLDITGTDQTAVSQVDTLVHRIEACFAGRAFHTLHVNTGKHGVRFNLMGWMLVTAARRPRSFELKLKPNVYLDAVRVPGIEPFPSFVTVLEKTPNLAANLRSLSIGGMHPSAIWVKLFPKVPLLETLTITGTPSREFWDALSDIRPAAASDELETPLPRLKAFNLDYVVLRVDPNFENDTFFGPWRGLAVRPDWDFGSGLLKWVGLRNQSGRPIAEITLSNCQGVTDLIVLQLQAVVEYVRWSPDT